MYDACLNLCKVPHLYLSEFECCSFIHTPSSKYVRYRKTCHAYIFIQYVKHRKAFHTYIFITVCKVWKRLAAPSICYQTYMHTCTNFHHGM